MPDDLMSDARQDQLMKGAAEVINLINIGVDPNAALKKVAADELMNDNEVTLVSHAVNNSSQLAHLQSSDDDEKEMPFPLTNADVVTGDRYSSQEEKSEGAKQTEDQPDAIGIKDNLDKEAAASLKVAGDYRRRPEAVDHAATLRAGWGLDQGIPKVAEHVDPNPFAKLSSYKLAIEEARQKAAAAKDSCLLSLDKLAEAFRQTAQSVRYDNFEKAAALQGVGPEFLDIVYAAAGDKWSLPRADMSVKTAHHYIDRDTSALVEECVRADGFWKEAAAAGAAQDVMQTRSDAAHQKLAEDFPVKASLSPGGLGDALGKAPEEIGGIMDPVSDIQMMADMDVGEKKDEAKLSPSFQSELGAYDTRNEIEDLMSDKFVGGYDVPEVVEAYNSAKSVAPNMGQAELVSYVRQHLATKGAVPLDIQARLHQAHKNKVPAGDE